MGIIRDFVYRLLKVEPARDRQIVIYEPLTFRANVLKNQVLYRGDPAELEQFFRQSAFWDIELARFWAAVPQGRVRKIHSGIVATVIDRYRDIVTADLLGVNFGEEAQTKHWEEIAKAIRFEELVSEAVAGALSSGDGAFKVSVDPELDHPVVAFYPADRVEIERGGRRVKDIRFLTAYKTENGRERMLEETYAAGRVSYRLLTEEGRETDLSEIAETQGLENAEFDGGFLMAVPLIVFGSSKWPGRGKALFDDKTDAVDALDEVISQWLDAVRMGRVKRYIPEDLIPRDPKTGALTRANPFDNEFIAVGSSKAEGAQDRIEVSQPQISYEAYVNSYSAFLDIVLQGIMSPATLGIDLKKTDNAEAQREKEKITMHVRGKIVDALSAVLPELAATVMRVDDLMHGRAPGEYEVSVSFGEYASPSFDATVETVGRARAAGVMSIEQSVEELYGDTWTEEEKAEEVSRLKAEHGIAELDEPAVNLDGLFGGEDDAWEGER